MTESSVFRQKIDLYVITWCSVCIGIGFAISLPTLEFFVTSSPSATPPGLGLDELYFSYIVSIFSVGELVGALVMGTVSNNISIRNALIITNSVGVLANILYGVAENGPVMLLSRFIVGLWSGGINALIRVYINTRVPKEDINKVMTIIGFFSCTAMAVGPIISGLFPAVNHHYKFFYVNIYRFPAWTVVGLCVLSTVASAFYSYSPQNKQNPTTVHKRVAWKLWDNNGVANSVIVISLLGFFMSSLGFTILETVATPLMADHFGITPRHTMLLFTFGGFGNALIFLVMIPLANRISNTLKSMACMFLSFVGLVVMIDWQSFGGDTCKQYPSASTCEAFSGCVWNQNGLHGPCDECLAYCHNPTRTLQLWQMYLGFVLINIAFPMGRVGTAALYSKLLQSKKQGFMMGLLVSSGSIARIVGPPVAMLLYVNATNRHTYLLMSILAVLNFVIGISFLRCRAAEQNDQMTITPTVVNDSTPLLNAEKVKLQATSAA